MRTVNCLASACRNCRYYQPEGRRGGQCQQLGVPVRGGWKACSLALSPFVPAWETLEDILRWQGEIQQPSLVPPVECSLNGSHRQDFETTNEPVPKIPTDALRV